MLRLKSIIALSLAVSAWAVPPYSKVDALQKRERDETGWAATIYIPTGQDDAGYEQSTDNGKSWHGNAKTSRMDFSPKTTGYRVKGQPESSFLARIPGRDVDWVTYDFNDDFRVGLYNEDGDLYTDHSKSPTVPVTPGEWIDAPVSADVSLRNFGQCDGVPDPFTVTVFYNNKSIASQVFSASSDVSAPPLQFHIKNLLFVKNITVDFAKAGIYPPAQAPFQVNYASAAGAPLVSGHVNIYGAFCDVDD